MDCQSAEIYGTAATNEKRKKTSTPSRKDSLKVSKEAMRSTA